MPSAFVNGMNVVIGVMTTTKTTTTLIYIQWSVHWIHARPCSHFKWISHYFRFTESLFIHELIFKIGNVIILIWFSCHWLWHFFPKSDCGKCACVRVWECAENCNDFKFLLHEIFPNHNVKSWWLDRQRATNAMIELFFPFLLIINVNTMWYISSTLLFSSICFHH